LNGINNNNNINIANDYSNSIFNVNNEMTNNNNNNKYLAENPLETSKKDLNASLNKSINKINSNNLLINQTNNNNTYINILSNKNNGILQFNKIRGLPTSQGSKYIN